MCATSSDGNGFLNLLQKAFSSKKQNCDTSVSQIFSKFTSVAGNLLGNSEKTDAGKGLVASKGAISKAADTLKTCLGKASEKASDADKANSARECREEAARCSRALRRKRTLISHSLTQNFTIRFKEAAA